MDTLRNALRAKYMEQAVAAFDELMLWQEAHGGARLLEMEEVIGRLKVDIARALLESVLVLRQAEEQGAVVPECAGCGGPMHYKGKKKKRIVTTAGEVDWERSHYYCEKCGGGVFPPGSRVRDCEGSLE
jgi:hypothetical protein